MRIAVLIIGILIGLFFIFFGFIEAIAETDELRRSGDYDQVVGTYWSMMVLWALGIAFVLGWPMVSVIIFLAAAVAGISAGVAAPGSAGVIGTWGLVSLALAFLSFLGWMGKRKDRRTFAVERARQDARDQQLDRLLLQQAQPGGRVTCPSCNASNVAPTRFCGNCGTALSAAPA